MTSPAGAWALGEWAQQLWRTGLLALQHMGSSRTRDPTCVPCIGRRILNHWTTKEFLRASSVGKYLWMVSKFCQSQDLSEPSILLIFMVFWTCSASLGWSFTLTLKHNLEFQSFLESLSWNYRLWNILFALYTFYEIKLKACQAGRVAWVTSRLPPCFCQPDWHFIYLPQCVACGILVSWTGIEPKLCAV